MRRGRENEFFRRNKPGWASRSKSLSANLRNRCSLDVKDLLMDGWRIGEPRCSRSVVDIMVTLGSDAEISSDMRLKASLGWPTFMSSDFLGLTTRPRRRSDETHVSMFFATDS